MNEMTGRMIPDKVVQSIRAAGNIVLLTHTHPDGDALGSLFGCADLLTSLGKNVLCFLEEPVSPLYDFLPHNCKVCNSIEAYKGFVDAAGPDILIVALDCGDDDRLGQFKKEFLKVEPFVAIDHHQSHRDFGTLRWVEPGRSSTGEMVYELSLALDTPISYNCAFNLYVAICTDTGSFRYDCTSSRTMKIAAELLEKGVKTEEVCYHLYDNYTQERLKIMEMALSTMTLCEADQIAFVHVTGQMLEKSGATKDDLEGIIDFPRSIRSVKVAVFIKEAGDGIISVSMRAKGECDVASIAKHFEGGGHRNAAGFKCQGKSIEQIRLEIKDAICKVLL